MKRLGRESLGLHQEPHQAGVKVAARVPITSPEVGVKPIVVSTGRPSWTAARLARHRSPGHRVAPSVGTVDVDDASGVALADSAGWLKRPSSSAIRRASCSAQARSPGPCSMAHPDREPGTELGPSVVPLDRDPDGDALDDLGELARDDVAGHQGELGPGRLVQPDDPAPERLGEGVDVEPGEAAGRDAGQAGLFEVGGDVEQFRVVQAQEGDARRGEVAEAAIPPDHDAGDRGADLRVGQVVLGRFQGPAGLLDGRPP